MAHGRRESEERGKEAPGGAGRSNVIPLAPYRDRSERARRPDRMEALLGRPNAKGAVQALPGEEIYALVRDGGSLREAAELLALATPEQVQIVMDLDLGSSDLVAGGQENEAARDAGPDAPVEGLSVTRLGEWVALMAELPVETTLAWMRELDTEIVALMIRKGARIYDLTLEEPPDDPAGALYLTPDRFFALDAVGYPPSVSGDALLGVIDAVYRTDLGFARRLLVGARAELDSTLEEMALRWRRGRLTDLGFPDPLEALAVYRELDPASVRIGELRAGTRLRPLPGPGTAPAPLPSSRAEAALLDLPGPRTSPFAEALARVPAAEEIEELRFAVASLSNRVLAADRVRPGDGPAVTAALERLRATLDLGVDFLARDAAGRFDDDRAVDAVRTVAPERLFRLGVSLVGKLRELARTLVRRGPFAALAGGGRSLVEEPEATVLDAVDRLRPLYPRVLDDPPTGDVRPFGTLADVARATSAIRRAAAAQVMLRSLGVSITAVAPQALRGAVVDGGGLPAPVPAAVPAVDTGVLARTALVLRAVARPRGGDQAAASLPFRPLSAAEVARFTRSGEGPSEAALARVRQFLEAVRPAQLGTAALDMSERWLGALAPMGPVLVRPAQRRRAPRGRSRQD